MGVPFGPRLCTPMKGLNLKFQPLEVKDGREKSPGSGPTSKNSGGHTPWPRPPKMVEHVVTDKGFHMRHSPRRSDF